MVKDLNAHQFYNYIHDDYQKFKKEIYKSSLTSKTKTLMFDVLVKCPNQSASQMSKTFHELGLHSKQDFVLKIDEIRDLLKLSTDKNYIWKDLVLQDEWFIRFKTQVEHRRSFVYMYRQAPHLETIYLTIRNAIAHGRFYIKDNFITLWNVRNQTEIKGLMHMNISKFNKIIQILNRMYESSIEMN
jgi:hypothetical protein